MKVGINPYPNDISLNKIKFIKTSRKIFPKILLYY